MSLPFLNNNFTCTLLFLKSYVFTIIFHKKDINVPFLSVRR
jgi:hypothetical protein